MMEKETLQIDLPSYQPNAEEKIASIIDHCDLSRITNFIIHQSIYYRYGARSEYDLVIIPKTITGRYFQVLDLTGCYYLLSVPNAILQMPQLKIKIGDVISLQI